MNLPFVLDVAIGLIFIFLILSLLASELQELLTTLLQWRAKHLKDSIEVLLSGEIETQEEAHVRELVSKLYDDPLIRNINQGAKGCLARMFRAITRWLLPGNQRGSFGSKQATGPSYIAPDTFATSILERVGLATLVKKLVEVRLEKFAKRIIGDYTPNPGGGPKNQVLLPNDDKLENSWDKGRVRLMAKAANFNLYQDGNFKILVEEFDDVLNDFKSGETNLETSVKRMGESFSNYIANYPIPDLTSQDTNSEEVSDTNSAQNSKLVDSTEAPTITPNEGIGIAQPVGLSQHQSDGPDLVYFAKRLRTLNSGIFGEKGERAIVSGGLRPSLFEIAELLNRSSGTYQEVVDAYKNLVMSGKNLDKEVLPQLKEELLTTRHVEAVEQELIANHLDAVVAQLTAALKTQHPRWYKELEEKLNKNKKQLDIAQVDANKPIRTRRGLLRRTRTWFVRRWRGLTISTPENVKRKRREIVTEMMDRLSEEEQLKLIKAVLESIDNDKNRHKLYGNVEQGCFGVIDHALNRLTDEERRGLIDKVLMELKYENDKRLLYDNYQTYKTIQLILSKLPNSVKESFAILARRAQTRVHQTGSDINQFREEVAVWFDRSMSRASGVYKRNAKGVAILIGLLLVVVTNVDAGFIVNRLSNDESLRNVVAERAVSINAEDLDAARVETTKALEELALPIGWSPANMTDQLNCKLPDGSNNLPSEWSEFYSICLGSQATSSQMSERLNQASTNSLHSFFSFIGNLLQNLVAIVVNYPLALLRILFGWLIAGIAISMGAPFWFDLLGKIVNVRNSGGKPPSTENQSVAKPATAEITVKQP